MALSGDFSGLQRTEVVIGGLRFVMPKAVAEAKGEVFEQYQLDWVKQADPWGDRWDPTQDGDSPALFDSGDLASPDVIVVGANKVQVKPERYWVFHQIGAHGMARRAVLPFSASNWDPPIKKRIESVILKQLEKAP